MSGLDTKQIVLVAIYTEYQKDIPNMRDITAKSLGLESPQFIVAIQKLENERLINGANYAKGGRSTIPLSVFMDNVMVTSYGLSYVEEKLGIQQTLSGSEKVKEVVKKATSWGYGEIKDFAAKVLAELLKGSTTNQE